MKSWINKLYQGFYRYRKLSRLIDERTIVKNVVKSMLGSLVLSLLAVLIPSLVVINMFIYAKHTLFLAILLVGIVVSWPFIYYAFYYMLLKNYHPDVKDINTKLPYIIESTLTSFVLLSIGIIVLSVIF